MDWIEVELMKKTIFNNEKPAGTGQPPGRAQALLIRSVKSAFALLSGKVTKPAPLAQKDW